jgi:Cu+-exporting ATPase
MMTNATAKTTHLRINGMSCAACALASERAVRKLPGVGEASVNFATEKLTVSFEESQVSLEAIKAAVAKAGYEAVDEKKDKSVSIPIGGMSCAACAQAVERAVRKVPGVSEASVNFATEKAAVSYDPGTARLSEIKAAIAKAGYVPLALEGGKEKDAHQAAKEREVRVLWAKFAVAASFAAPLLYLAMGGMLGWPLPAFLRPMDYPLRYALAELALVLPVIAAGYRFYLVGFKAIWRRAPNMDSLIAMGTSAAVLYSSYSLLSIAAGNFRSVNDLYFETAGVIIALILLGKSLEAVSK